MSCTALSDDQRQVLDLLARGSPVPDDLAPTLGELVRWGWVMKSGELTGVGLTHAGEITPGLVGRE